MQPTPLRVLLVEDSDNDARLVTLELKRAGFEPDVIRTQTEVDYVNGLKSEPDIILSDYTLPQFDALRALELLKERQLEIPFLIISGTIGEETAVSAMRLGAWDYLLKDRMTRLGSAVSQALERKSLLKEKKLANLRADFLASIVDTSEDAIIGMTLEGIILSWNQGAGTTYHCSADEMIGDSIRALFPENLQEECQHLLATINNGQSVVQWETIQQRKNGTLIDVSMTISPVRDLSGQVIAVSMSARDITQRKILEERQLLLLGILETTTDFVYIASPDDHHLLYANRAAREALGIEDVEAVGQRSISDVHPEWAYRHLSEVIIPTVLELGTCTVESALLGHDGQDIPVSLVGLATRDESGKVSCLSAIMRDISKLKTAEKRLQETNQWLELIIDTSPLAILTLDREQNVLSWNCTAEQMFGWKEEEIRGKPLPLVAPEDLDDHLEILSQMRQGQKHAGVELRRLHKKGTFVIVHLWTSPLRDSEGEIIAYLGVLADVSERKQLEEQFLHAQKMEAVGRLAGGVAHDFNNVLTVINGYTELILETLSREDPNRAILETVYEAGDQAARLTQQLLAFSRKQLVSIELLDLNEVVGVLEKMLPRLIGEDVQLITRLDSELPMIKADVGQLDQIIVNLAVNARDAMPQGGAFTIETSTQVRPSEQTQSQTYVVLSLSDTGCGMDEETRKRIFEPFFTTKEQGKGTGLKLATIFGLVQQCVGTIEVDTEVGKGTTFKICFPAVEGVPPATQVHDKVVIEPLTEQQTILLVEDDDGLRALVRHLLQSGGYSVLEAINGVDALDMCDRHWEDIDLVLTDVVMPDAGGRELQERLFQRAPTLKVLFMSGYTEDEILRQGIRESQYPILRKPFKVTTLLSTIRNCLRT